MLEALSILLEKQGRSQAAPLAAGVKPGRIRCSVRPVPQYLCRMLRASYIPGTGTGRQGSAPYPASGRPQKTTNKPYCCNSALSRLGALLSKELTADEKLNIIETEYNIPVEDHMREDVKVMCNLSQGIKEIGIEPGKAKAAKEVVMNMHRNGFTIEQITLAVGKSAEEVEAIIKKKELVMAQFGLPPYIPGSPGGDRTKVMHRI